MAQPADFAEGKKLVELFAKAVPRAAPELLCYRPEHDLEELAPAAAATNEAK